MALALDLHQQIYRGKAPKIFLAQPEGLGYGVIDSRRANGPAVNPIHIVRQFRSHAFYTTTGTRLDRCASHGAFLDCLCIARLSPNLQAGLDKLMGLWPGSKISAIGLAPSAHNL